MQSNTAESNMEPHILKRQTQSPASEADKQTFMKSLRGFYRTGELPGEQSSHGFSSIFMSDLAQKEMPFPAKFGTKEVFLHVNTLHEIMNAYIANYQLDIHTQFKQKLQALIAGLTKRLNIKPDPLAEEASFDFASEIIAFDKLSELIPKQKAADISDTRKKRLQEVLEQLNSGLHDYQKQEAVLIHMQKEKPEAYGLSVKCLQLTPDHIFSETQRILKEHMMAFADLMRAFRIATLEVEDAFEEEIHEDHFAHFSWYRLTEAEKQLFQPFILVVDHATVLKQMGELSELLSANWPIKLLVTNDLLVSEPDQKSSWEEASHRYRQELAVWTVAHRNVALYQLTMADTERLAATMNRWMHTHSPALMHLLIPNFANDNPITNLRGAVLSRFFPNVSYDPNSGESAKWSINNNREEIADWTSNEFQVEVEGKQETMTVSFTYADYKALYASKVEELMLIPPAYENEYLVPLDVYLTMDQEALIGKVPYIWLTDGSNVVHRAAVPNVWVVSCQERLDFWNFLQEMARSKQDPSSTPLSEANGSDITAKLTEDELNQLKEEATQQAAQRLITELLKEE